MVCSRNSGFDTRSDFCSVIGVGFVYELHRFDRCAAKLVTQHRYNTFAPSPSA